MHRGLSGDAVPAGRTPLQVRFDGDTLGRERRPIHVGGQQRLEVLTLAHRRCTFSIAFTARGGPPPLGRAAALDCRPRAGRWRFPSIAPPYPFAPPAPSASASAR